MNKNSIKKLIISIVFIVFLIMFFLLWKSINDDKENKRISIVKSIVKEKYDKINYDENSKYIFTEKKDVEYTYDVFDFHGTKQYSIKTKDEINIVKVMKKYYITYDEIYHLFNSDNQELISGKVIEGLNEYLIKVDNKIISNDNDVLFDDVHDLKSYSNNKYFNINNYYLIDKKGEVLLENVIVNDEIKDISITDYLIIKKENKYYTFFTKIDKIIGDGFDSYTIDKNLLIKNNNNIYKIYKTGLRKKINTISSKLENKYIFDNRYIIKNYSFVMNKKNNYFGLLNLKKNKFTKITKQEINEIIRIDNNDFLIKTEKDNYVINLNKEKVVYSTKVNVDNIVIFKNGYKTIENEKKYSLYNSNDKKIIEYDKQIIINSKIEVGDINNEFYLYNLDNKSNLLMNKIIINDVNYYYHDDIIYDNTFNKINDGKLITFNKDSIIYSSNRKLVINNKKENKIYNYELVKDEGVVNNITLNNLIIIEGDKYIKILDNKGNLLKKIKNRKLLNYYITNRGQVIIITGIESDDKVLEGSYLAE